MSVLQSDLQPLSAPDCSLPANSSLACIHKFLVNNKEMDFAPSLVNAVGVNAGCIPKTAPAAAMDEQENAGPLEAPNEVAQADAGEQVSPVGTADCRSEGLECLNGGVCVPGFALPVNNQAQQWVPPSRNVCRCPTGYDGIRCENCKLGRLFTE